MNSRQKPYTYTVSIDAKNSDDKLLVTGQDKYDAQPNEIQTFQIWVDTKTEGFKYEFDICIYWYDNKFSDERQRNCLDKHYVIEYPKLEMTFREVIRKASQIDCFLYDPAPIALITVISDLNPSASIRYIMPPSWENRIQSNDLSDFRVNFSESQKSPPYIVIDNSKLILILSPGFGITTSSEQEIVRQYVEKFNKVYLTAQKAHIDKFTEGQESLHLDKLEKGAIEEFAEPVGVSPNITSQIDISDGTVIFQLTPDMWIFSTEITK